mgnify:CR=1 FL=1
MPAASALAAAAAVAAAAGAMPQTSQSVGMTGAVAAGGGANGAVSSLGGGAAGMMGEEYADDGTTRAVKRPRLVWTPQLHRKFESAVIKLGEDKAVPKTIMQVCVGYVLCCAVPLGS